MNSPLFRQLIARSVQSPIMVDALRMRYALPSMHTGVIRSHEHAVSRTQ